MTEGVMRKKLENLKNSQHQLNEAAGAIMVVEIKMRWIGELSEPTRNKLKEIVPIPRKNKSSDYWDCILGDLEQAIKEVFSSSREKRELEEIENFRKLRNKFIHGDFVTFMNLINGVYPTGREIVRGGRNTLTEKDLMDSILSPEWNLALLQLRIKADEVGKILENIILSHSST